MCTCYHGNPVYARAGSRLFIGTSLDKRSIRTVSARKGHHEARARRGRSGGKLCKNDTPQHRRPFLRDERRDTNTRSFGAPLRMPGKPCTALAGLCDMLRLPPEVPFFEPLLKERFLFAKDTEGYVFVDRSGDLFVTQGADGTAGRARPDRRMNEDRAPPRRSSCNI